MISPTLVHAIGEGVGGRVRLTPITAASVYSFVSCDHPDEFLEAVRLCCSDGTWIPCDDGSLLHLRHVVKIEIEDALP